MCAAICVFHDREISYIWYYYVLLTVLMGVFYKRFLFILKLILEILSVLGRYSGANINHKIVIFFPTAADQMLLRTFIFKYFLTLNP
jgi:hypothetical protein